MQNRNYWFGHKWLGAGLAPASWQGWLCLLAYVVILGWTLTVGRDLIPNRATAKGVSLALAALETLALFWIVWATRDKSRVVRWRWFGGR